MEKVCNMLPATLTAQCKDLIEAYGEAIIELLVQQADPKSICTVLGLCKGADRSLIRELPSLPDSVLRFERCIQFFKPVSHPVCWIATCVGLV